MVGLIDIIDLQRSLKRKEREFLAAVGWKSRRDGRRWLWAKTMPDAFTYGHCSRQDAVRIEWLYLMEARNG